jgi:hypothetical protein
MAITRFQPDLPLSSPTAGEPIEPDRDPELDVDVDFGPDSDDEVSCHDGLHGGRGSLLDERHPSRTLTPSRLAPQEELRSPPGPVRGPRHFPLPIVFSIVYSTSYLMPVLYVALDAGDELSASLERLVPRDARTGIESTGIQGAVTWTVS